MDRNRFNNEVRPYLTNIPIGRQGIAFDRLELDAWADEYKACNGRPGRTRGGKTWDRRERQASSNVVAFGTLRNRSEDDEFEKAVAQVTSAKQRRT